MERPAVYKQKSTLDPVYHDFINDKTFIMRPLATIETICDNCLIQQPFNRAYTVLWIKESQGLKAINMHLSQQQINFDFTGKIRYKKLGLT